MMRMPLFAITLMVLCGSLTWADDEQDFRRALQTSSGPDYDYETAISIYKRLAEKGDARSQHNLAIMYWEGVGVAKDYVQAHMWFNLAAEGLFLAKVYRDKIAEKMTPEQIAEAERLAREWMEKHKK